MSHMMPVEARSLADITSLAFNPPLRPAPSTFSHINALTLYIVRVPGSRDVFLTPLKPGNRVVNAQDVESSLYFLHVDTQEDQLIREMHSPLITSSDAFTGSQPIRKPIYRKPLPTPPTSPLEIDLGTSPSSPRQSWSPMPRRKPVLPARDPNRSSMSSLGSMSPEGRHQSPITSDGDEATQKFTLIRRDPSTGAQWNIARIQDPPVDEVSSASHNENHRGARLRKNAGAPMYLAITNAGYARYSMQDEQVLKRRMWMDGSRHADHSYSSQPLTISTSSKRSHKGYAFLDLWNQQCAFNTSSSGRALKCIRDDPSSKTEISELRFNLPVPHSPIKSDPPRNSVDLSTASKRSSYISHSDITLPAKDDLNNIDYSLGRERAGGGFGGRDAKLGKLIIYEAGQEMLDLVVAANMALWWRAYERTASR